MKTNAVCFKNVCFSYGKKTVIKDLSFKVPSGSFFYITGNNGSGKSTVAKLICSVLEPASGTVEVDGYAGLIFQNPQNQMVGLTVEEEVAFGPENLGLPSSEIRQRVDSSLALVGLDGKQKELTEHLSGGQVQALAIAGILAMDSKIIVCDESCSMLDNECKAQVIEVLHKLNSQGKTIIYITNDPDEIQSGSDVLEIQ